jgi:predicted transcriptional regulator
MGYRSRTEIVGQILKVANGGATKTKIMYEAFLNFAQMKDYLKVLTEDDLLSYDGQTHRFKTTKRGLQFLDKYNQIEAMIKEKEQPTSPSQQQISPIVK